MSVKPPSALTCPGAHDPTSPQSFPMTFTKSSKSPKLPKISDNIVEQTSSTPNHFCFLFFFFPHVLVGHCRSWFLLFPSRGLIIGWSLSCVLSVPLPVSSLSLHLCQPAMFPLRSRRCPSESQKVSQLLVQFVASVLFHRIFIVLKQMLFTHQCCFLTVQN